MKRAKSLLSTTIPPNKCSSKIHSYVIRGDITKTKAVFPLQSKAHLYTPIRELIQFKAVA